MNVRRIIYELYLQERNLPFSWEDGGCLSFPGKCAKAITGRDPTEQVKGTFSSEAEATLAMSANGCEDIDAVVRKVYAEIPVASAQPGDWATVQNEDGTDGLGVVMGSQIVARTVRGPLGVVPLTRARKAYRVSAQ